MQGKRLWHTIRLFSIQSASKRAEYLMKHHVFKQMGKECSFMPRTVPLHPDLIILGNNVHVASNVSLVTHDIANLMLNKIDVGGVN